MGFLSPPVGVGCDEVVSFMAGVLLWLIIKNIA